MSTCDMVGCYNTSALAVQGRGNFCNKHYEAQVTMKQDKHGNNLVAEACPEDTVARFGLNKISMRVDDLQDMERQHTAWLSRMEGELKSVVAELGKQHVYHMGLMSMEARDRQALKKELNHVWWLMFAVSATTAALAIGLEQGWF